MNETYFANLTARLNINSKQFDKKFLTAVKKLNNLHNLARKPMVMDLKSAEGGKVKVVAASFSELNKKIGSSISMMSKFSESLSSNQTAINNQANRIDKLRARIEKLEKSTRGAASSQQVLRQNVKMTTVQFQDFDKMMTVALQKLIRYRMIFYVGQAVVQGYSGAIKTVTKASYEMAQIQKVMTDEMFKSTTLWKIAEDSSVSYGQSITDTIQGMKIWAQQGRDVYEIQKLHEATMLGSATANITAHESVEALTAATKAYKINLEDLTGVVDIWMNVQAKHAVTAKDLANALKIVANAAQLVGVDMQSLAANVTAVVAVTRKSGTAVANSLKTIFSRFSRPVAQNAFQRLNIDTRESIGVLRDFDSVMQDLYGRWDNLNDVQRIGIAYAMGGVRRYADFTALMENYGEKLQATANAHTAESAAARALSIEMDTLKKKMDQISAVSSKIGLGAGSVFISSFDAMASAIVALDKTAKGLDKTFGKALGTLGVFLAIMTGMFVLRSLSKMFVSFGHNIIENAAALKIEGLIAHSTKEQIILLGHSHGVLAKEVTVANITAKQLGITIESLNAKYIKLAQTSATTGKAVKASLGTAFFGGPIMKIATALAVLISVTALVRSNTKGAQSALSDQNREIIRNFELTNKQLEIMDVYLDKLTQLEIQVNSYTTAEIGMRNGALEMKEAAEKNTIALSGLSTMLYQTEGIHVKLGLGAEKLSDSVGMEAYNVKVLAEEIKNTKEQIMEFYAVIEARHAKQKERILGPIPEDIDKISKFVSKIADVETAKLDILPSEEEFAARLEEIKKRVSTPSVAPVLPSIIPIFDEEITSYELIIEGINNSLKDLYSSVESRKTKGLLAKEFEDLSVVFGVENLGTVRRLFKEFEEGTISAGEASKEMLNILEYSLQAPIDKLERIRDVIFELRSYSRSFQEAEKIKAQTGFRFISDEFIEKLMPELARFEVKVNTLATNIDLSAFRDPIMEEFDKAMDISVADSDRWVEDAALSIQRAYRKMTELAAASARKEFAKGMPTVAKELSNLEKSIPMLKLKIAIAGIDTKEMKTEELAIILAKIEELKKRIAKGEGKELVYTLAQLIEETIRATDETYNYSGSLETATTRLAALRQEQRARNDESERGSNLYKQEKKGLENSLAAQTRLGATLEEQLKIRRSIINAEYDAKMASFGASVPIKDYEATVRIRDNALALLDIDEKRIVNNAEITKELGKQINITEQHKGVLNGIISIYQLANVPLIQQKETLKEIIEDEYTLAMIKAGGNLSAQNQADADRTNKNNALDTKIIYEDILSDIKEITKHKFKQASIEKNIYQSLGKAVGINEGVIKEKQLQNELRFRSDILDMHKRDVEVAKNRLRQLGWSEEKLSKLVDFNKMIFRDEQKIRDLQHQLNLTPLLADLAKVQEQLKDTLKLYDDIAKGIAAGLGGVPDAIGDMYETRQDFLKQIAEKEEEIAKIQAEADPGAENYRTQLDLVDRMQAKVNAAKKDVAEMTGVLSTVLSVIGSIGDKIADTYNKILQDFFTEKITDWLKQNIEISFEGQILSASEQGAEKFYDAITRAVDDKMSSMRDIYGAILTDAQRAVLDPLVEGGSNAEIKAALDLLASGTTNMIAATNYLRYGKALSPTPMTSDRYSPGTSEWFAAKEAEDMLTEQKGMRADWAGYIDYLGVIIGTAVGGGKPGSAMGAQVAGLSGQFLASQFAASLGLGVSSVLPGILSIFGGMIGPWFVSEKKELDLEVEALKENTDALNGNTRAVEQLTERLLNAPSSFTIPSLAHMGGGGGTIGAQARLSGTSRKYLL